MCQPEFSLYDENDNPVARACAPKCSSAWIDPTGKFYPVRDCGHSSFADFHFNTFDLEGRGWVHLSFGYIYTGKPPRQAQLDTLFDALMVAEEHGYQYAEQLRLSYNVLLRNIDNDY